MSQNSIAQMIADNFHRFTESEKAIAEVLVSHSYELAFFGIHDLATASGVSESTVVRFAYKLGLDGFRELQSVIQRDLQQSLHRNLAEKHNEHSSLDGSFDSNSLQRLMEQEIECIKTSYRTIVFRQFAEIADRMAKAANIYVTGARTSAPTALLFFNHLNMIRPGVKSLVLHSDNVFQGMVDMTEDDVLFAFSFARYSSQTLAIMDQAKKTFGSKVFCMTDSLLGPSAHLADEVLITNRLSAHFLASNTAAISLCYALIGAIAEKLGTDVRHRIEDIAELSKLGLRDYYTFS